MNFDGSKMKIDFLNLNKINNKYTDEINKRFSDVFCSGIYLNGREKTVFENNFAKYTGVKYCIAVSTGLSALELIIKAYGFKKGDEIIVPSNTYIATVWAVIHSGCTPVFVEPDINTMNIDVNKIENNITSGTKAVLPVHLYGQAVQTDKIKELANKYNLKIIEDCAQSHGGIYKNIKTGALGDASGFSFYPSKNLGSMGLGGAVCTNDKNLAEKVRALANYGAYKRNEHIFDGTNSRLDEFQAVVLDVKLKYLDEENNLRRRVSKLYRENIKNPEVMLPQTYDEKAHVWHIFAIRSKKRDKLKEYLAQNGIETSIHYPVPLHKQKCLAEYTGLDLPLAEKICNSVLSIPVSPRLSDMEIEYIIDKINKFN